MVAEDPNACLHLVMSPLRSVLSRCLVLTRSGDQVVFLGDGVLLLVDPRFDSVALTGCQISILASDARARGIPLEQFPGEVAAVTEAALVGLVKRCPHSLSWL